MSGLREKGRTAAAKVMPAVFDAASEMPRLRRQVQRQRQRIGALEVEIQECRMLNRRVAELTDVVQELLLPVAQRDEAGVQAVLKRYADRI